MSLYFFVGGHVGHFRPVLSNVAEFVAHGHCEPRFDAGKGLTSIDHRGRCDVDHLGYAAALNWLPVVTFECSHDVFISEQCFALDECQANILIDGFNQVSVRVVVEGVDHHKVCHKAGLDLANEWIPLCSSSRVGCDHFR